MRTPARLGFLAVAVLAAAAHLGADPPAASSSLGTLTLADGRVLHNVRIVPNAGNTVTLRSDEGLLLVAKSLLPAALAPAAAGGASAPADPGMMMEPFDPNLAPPQEPDARPGSKAKPLPAAPDATKALAQPVASAVFKGCSVVSFQAKAFQNVQGCAKVLIRNETDNVVLLVPRDIACLTSEGARHTGRFFVTDGFPPAIKRREFVPARGQVEDVVTFTDDRIAIAAVQWTR
jgi:hypothetical protein